MKILLISDTHGDISRVMMILDRIRDIDCIVHCGDHQSDAWTLEDCTGIPVTCVAGNCDGGGLSDRKVLETPAGRLLITHGHMEGAGFTYNNLIYAAEEQDCVAVCFGHTHVPVCEDCGGIWLVNPGSLTHPRGGSAPSYAVLRCEEDLFHATLADFDTLIQTAPVPEAAPQAEGSAAHERAPQKKKTKGGFLRNLLNYSDRF